MPDAPWRCSQCGTVNEPAATSCRTCGRWPSLFDLQDSAVEAPPAEESPFREVPRYEPEEQEAWNAPEGVSETTTAEPAPPQTGSQPSTARTSWRGRSRSPAQRLVRLIVPVAALLYFLISSYLSNH